MCSGELEKFEKEWDGYIDLFEEKYGSNNWQAMEYLLLKMDLLIKFGKHKKVGQVWQRVEQLYEKNKKIWMQRETRKFAEEFEIY